MNSGDLNIIEMLGCIYEDLDIEKIEEKFVDLVNDAFSFDRVALFFVKHKKGILKGKLSHGFDQAVVKSIEIPLSGKSLLIDPLITGMAYRGISNIPDQYADLLGLTNFALIPIVNKKRMACWKIKNCGSKDCPAYGKKWIRCWLVSGTKCSNGGVLTPAEKTRQCSTCPIFADMNIDTVEGVMIVDNSISSRPITDKTVTVLSIIAHTVGMAINNSKLYMKTLDVSIRDPLTGLHNRRYFNERLLDEVERASRYDEHLSLVICDIDHFKKINDSYGHPAGDTVLCRVAEVLRNNTRKNDIVSRYGGEEFALLLLNTEKSQAAAIAEKIRRAFEESPFILNGEAVRVTLSFGLSSFGVDSSSFEGLISCADRALYSAKARGRNMVCSD